MRLRCVCRVRSCANGLPAGLESVLTLLALSCRGEIRVYKTPWAHQVLCKVLVSPMSLRNISALLYTRAA